MFENIVNFFKKLGKNEKEDSRTTAKERLHLVLAQDRANISADFLEMMKQEIIEVIKKYVDIDESSIDVRMTNKPGEDGTVGAPALYANIPIVTIKNEARKLEGTLEKKSSKDKMQEEEETENKKEDITNGPEETKKDNVENVEETVLEQEKVTIQKEEKQQENPQEKTETKTVNKSTSKKNTNKSKKGSKKK